MNPTYVYTKPKICSSQELLGQIIACYGIQIGFVVYPRESFHRRLKHPRVMPVGEHYKHTIGTLYLN